MRKPNITPKQIHTLKSMGLYWAEIQKRPEEQRYPAMRHELLQLIDYALSPEQILSIILLYVNQLP